MWFYFVTKPNSYTKMEFKLSWGAKSGTQGTHKDPETDTGTQDEKLTKSKGKRQT